jgi:hypothetical protein
LVSVSGLVFGFHNSKELSVPVYTDDITLKRAQVGILGPAGAGKTRLMTTASKFFPKERADKRVTLEDMHVILADAGGTDTLICDNVRCTVRDLNALCGDEATWREVGFKKPPSYTEAAAFAIKEAGEIKSNIVGVDSFTQLAHRALIQYTKQTAGSRNKYEKYDLLGMFLKAFQDALAKECPWVIYTLHTRRASEDEDPDQALAFSLPGMPKIIADIPGKSGRIAINDLSAEFFLLAEESTKKKGEFNRVVYTKPGAAKGGQVKNRWEPFLDRKEPADLGLIIEKVRKGAGL